MCARIIFFALLFFSVQSVKAQQSDPRVLRYYSEKELSGMTPRQLSELNFVFQRSWVVNTDKPCAECPAIDLNAFDVNQYQRFSGRRNRIYLTVPGHPIEILSYEELDAALNQFRQSASYPPQSN